MKSNQGFTLIELLIAVAIVGIIAGVAVPSYNNYMVEARRTEAQTLLIEMAGEQYRYFSENNTYADKLTTLGYGSDSESTENGFYSISVTEQSANSYTLTAAPVAGKSQATDDTACKSLTINSVGTKGVTGSAGVDECW